MNIVIPMAGEGSRFKVCGYENPKPLIEIDGKPMIQLAVETLGLEGKYIFVIREYDNKELTIRLENLLKSIKKDCIIVKTDTLTKGATATCLLAKKYFDDNEKLIITNCDQLMHWDSKRFQNFINDNSDLGGIVITYDSLNEKNSFVKLEDNGYASLFKEKERISDKALIGLHYWKQGKDFVSSAERMINQNNLSQNEYYIAPTYNYLIDDGLKITNYHLKKNQYIPVGTPEDLKVYIGKKNEFLKSKPSTILCDLDGTILKHVHRYSSITLDDCALNPGVKEKFDEWDSLGHKIILMTARKESARKITEACLEKLVIPYDMLIMGVTSGKRIIINDKLGDDYPDRALSVSVIADEGFNNINWKKYEL